MLALVTERWILTETPAILVFTAQISPKAHLAPRGFAKVRYRGLAKNLARAQTMFALADLYQVRRQLLRWRRDGWSALWRYRARGRWRGGRPRISSEVRHLIIRMARENFLWGAPRIHGELLMLGFSVSQATVSRYMPARSRRRSNRGGLFFAIKPWPSVTANIPRNGRVETLAHRASPIRPS